jgi:hypothetical protein
VSGVRYTVAAATFRAWFDLLEDIVAHDPEETAPGNLHSAVILLHDLVGVGLRAGAIRAVVIHSSGPSSFAHLMFRYTLNPEFDWDGEIILAPEMEDDRHYSNRLIAEIIAATGIPRHDDA